MVRKGNSAKIQKGAKPPKPERPHKQNLIHTHISSIMKKSFYNAAPLTLFASSTLFLLGQPLSVYTVCYHLHWEHSTPYHAFFLMH